MTDGAWDLFISYSRRDTEICNRIVSALSNVGINCWIDREGIDGASPWAQTIGTAINNAKLVLLVASKDSLLSDNVYNEIDLAATKKKKILPLEVDPFPEDYPLQYHIHSRQRVLFPRQATDDQVAAMVTSVRRILERTEITINTLPPPPDSLEGIKKASGADTDLAFIRFKDEIRQALEVDDELTPNDQRVLIDVGIQIGLSADRAKEILEDILNKEKIYLQEIHAALEDGKISNTEQNFLSRQANTLGISPERAAKLLQQEQMKILPPPDEAPPWEYFQLGDMTVGQVLNSSDQEKLLTYIAFYAVGDGDACRDILKQLNKSLPNALIKDVIENYTGFLDADKAGELSIADARAWKLEKVIKNLTEGLSLDEIKRVLDETHGRAKVRKAFQAYWLDTKDDPPKGLPDIGYFTLGDMKAGEVLAHHKLDHLVWKLEYYSGISVRTIKKYLSEAAPNGLIKDVVRNYRRMLDPVVLATRTVAEARDCGLAEIIAEICGISDVAEVVKTLNSAHGGKYLQTAFSEHWPK